MGPDLADPGLIGPVWDPHVAAALLAVAVALAVALFAAFLPADRDSKRWPKR